MKFSWKLNSKLLILFPLFFFNFSQTAKAQSWGRILWSDFASPVNTYSGAVLIGGGVLAGVFKVQQNDFNRKIKNKSEYKPILGKYGYIGEVIGWGFLNGFYSLGYGTYGLVAKDAGALERTEVMVSSSFFTLLSTVALKLSINESRPAFPEKEDSFPSGHSSMAFNFATVVWAEHGLLWGIPATLLAAGISISRVSDGWHWTSDTVFGASLGITYGLGVYLNRRIQGAGYWFDLVPIIDREKQGLEVSLAF